jgi:hypothetical protein
MLTASTATTIRNSARICHHGMMSANTVSPCVGAGVGVGVVDGGSVIVPLAGVVDVAGTAGLPAGEFTAGAEGAGVLTTGITGIVVGDVLLFG